MSFSLSSRQLAWQLARREQVVAVETAIANLPEQYRVVITLAKIVGLSRKDLAEQMGRTLPLVRNPLNRTLARLSAILDENM